MLLSFSMGGFASRAAAAFPRGETREQAFAERCVATLRHADSAAWIGRRYLKLAPGDADVPALVAAVSGGQFERLLRAGDSALRDALSVRKQADFADGNVIDLDGWVLSATEVRLCAIAALRA